MFSNRKAADAQDDGPLLGETQHATCFFAARYPRPDFHGARQQTDPFIRDAPGAKVPDSVGPNRFDPLCPLESFPVSMGVQVSPRSRHRRHGSLATFAPLEDDVPFGVLPPAKQVRGLNCRVVDKPCVGRKPLHVPAHDSRFRDEASRRKAPAPEIPHIYSRDNLQFMASISQGL